jgi:hypothetical protein
VNIETHVTGPKRCSTVGGQAERDRHIAFKKASLPLLSFLKYLVPEHGGPVVVRQKYRAGVCLHLTSHLFHVLRSLNSTPKASESTQMTNAAQHVFMRCNEIF